MGKTLPKSAAEPGLMIVEKVGCRVFDPVSFVERTSLKQNSVEGSECGDFRHSIRIGLNRCSLTNEN
jgi:hypothetical protein